MALPNRDELKEIGRQLTELLKHYSAVSLEVFQQHVSKDESKLIILFKDQNGKVVAQREFPKS